MKTLLFVTCLAMCFAIGCTNVESELEQEIALSKVPAAAVRAAEGAVDGITITGANVEIEDGQTFYVLEGMADGKEYEIDVTSAGKVIEVEQEDEDEDDDDIDDDDDDDEDDDEDDEDDDDIDDDDDDEDDDDEDDDDDDDDDDEDDDD